MQTKLGTILIILFSQFASGQDCDIQFLNDCQPPESNFIYENHKASAAFAMLPGSTKVLSLTLDAGMDYRVFLCTNDPEGILLFKLVKKDSTIFYSNEDNNYSRLVEFRNRVEQVMQLEITLPDENELSEERCIALIMEQMKTPKTGF